MSKQVLQDIRLNRSDISVGKTTAQLLDTTIDAVLKLVEEKDHEISSLRSQLLELSRRLQALEHKASQKT